jgi:hypothetical protein
MSKATQVRTAFLVVVNSVVTLLASLGSIDWSDTETLAVYAVANTLSALVLAVLAHVQRGTKREPVAIQASAVAAATSLLVLANAFGWWLTTEDQLAKGIAVVAPVAALVAAMFSRQAVTAETAPPSESNPGVIVNPEGQGDV